MDAWQKDNKNQEFKKQPKPVKSEQTEINKPIAIAIIAFIVAFIGAGTDNFGLMTLATSVFTISSIIAVMEFKGKLNAKSSAVKQKKLLKRRFHEKQRLISETGNHSTALMRDLNKKTKKDNTDKILEEFFAGISLDMKAVEFPEAKEIVLEELKTTKKTKT